MSQLGRARQFYDRIPAEYDRGMSSWPARRVLERRRAKVGEIVRGRILDIAFGTGLSLPHYPASAWVVGVDASLGMLRLGRERAKRLGRRVDLVQMDAEQLAFADGTFDSVAFNLCLCEIANPEQAVREAVRVARPGAPITFLEHVRSHLLPVAIVQDVFNPLFTMLVSDHINRRTADTVRRAGVEIDSVDRWFLGIFNLIVGHAPEAGRA
ncbi:MAG: methyltransferase domain-containing protein [Chloroflexi bacterium]|nr:MAG: methyltransferase domain-containing protein [Chloroflexota bacterium]